MNSARVKQPLPADRCDTPCIHQEEVDAVRSLMPPKPHLESAAAFARVMGDPTRFAILTALDRGELCVCDLGHLLGMSVSAVSHQLRRLRESNLVKARRHGKMMYYTIADDHIHMMLKGFLDHAGEQQQAL